MAQDCVIRQHTDCFKAENAGSMLLCFLTTIRMGYPCNWYIRMKSAVRPDAGIVRLVWAALLLGTKGLVLVYVLFGFLFYCFAQSALVSYIKGTAVRITRGAIPRPEAADRGLLPQAGPGRGAAGLPAADGRHAQRLRHPLPRPPFPGAVFGRGRRPGGQSGCAEFLHRPRDRPHQAQAPELVDRADAGVGAAAGRRGLFARPRIHLRPPWPGRLRQSGERRARPGRAGGRRQARARP